MTKRSGAAEHRMWRDLHDLADAGDPVARALIDAPADDEPADDEPPGFVRYVPDPPEECG